MKVLIASTLAAGLVFLASPTFAQIPGPTATPGPTAIPGGPTATRGAPGVHPNMGKPEDHAQYHQQWEDCMRQQEAKYGGVKTAGPHAGANNKGNYKASSKGKPMPPDEKADAKKGEKENRHQAEMDDCRAQLYGRDAPAPGKK